MIDGVRARLGGGGWQRAALAGFAILAVLSVAAARPAVAATATLISLDDLNHQGPLLAKDDSVADPVTLEESTVLSALTPAITAGGDAPPVIHALGTTIRARAVVTVDFGRAASAPADVFRLVGTSSVRALSFISGPGRPGADPRTIVFELAARAPLQTAIALVEGEVEWRLVRRYRAPIPCARTRHTVFVTAGPPLPARSWPITGAGGPRDHNAPTVARLRASVVTARGARDATAAATLAWRAAAARFSLDSDPDVNPWDMLATGAYGQCMSTAALIESMVALLGFRGGAVVYVYPALRPASAPDATSYPHALIPGAFTVEGPRYDARGQFRGVAADPAHAGAMGARHRGTHGIERLKMRDFHGGLHNYAAAFVIEEGGVRSYFGGGYGAGPYHDAVSFLAAACTAVVWAYEDEEADVWDAICDHPGPAYWWATGLPFASARAELQ